MKLPNDNDTLTQNQINSAVNITSFDKPTPNKNWHYGQFEPWALKFGYLDGKPIYGSVSVGSQEYHIYFLNDGHKLPIILKPKETPDNYNVKPT